MGSNLKLNDKIEEYINSHSIKLHPVQYEIIKYNETLGEIKKMQISVSQCHFLHFIVKITKPKNILEIGTFTGLSALTMGLAMDDSSMGGDGIPGTVAPSAPMDAAIAAIDEVAAEVIADEAPDVAETGPDVDPGMVDEQPQDDSSDIA